MKNGKFKGVQYGRDAGGGVSVIKESAASGAPATMAKIRCPNCRGYAVATQGKGGRRIYKCTTAACSASFTATRM